MPTVQSKLLSRPPINVEFQVPMFTASGAHVRFLRVYDKIPTPSTDGRDTFPRRAVIKFVSSCAALTLRNGASLLQHYRNDRPGRILNERISPVNDDHVGYLL
jgi:hypothetical protein